MAMPLNRLRLHDFSAFKLSELEFVDGLNVFVGANGTGKTHVLKVMYSLVESVRSETPLAQKLAGVFKPQDNHIGRLARRVHGLSTAKVILHARGQGLTSFELHTKDGLKIEVEDQLAFEFDRPIWDAVKWDDDAGYRDGLRRSGASAVDILATMHRSDVYMIEVKDPRGYSIEYRDNNPSERLAAPSLRITISTKVATDCQRSLLRDSFAWMKRIAPVVMLLFIFAGIAHAIELGPVTIRNSSGSSIGKVDSDGTIRNSSESSVGKLDKDGTIRNGSGSSVGKIDSDGTVRNGSGSSIGKIDDDGTIRNGSGSSVGKIDSDGTIRNGSGSSVGKVDGYSSGLRHLVGAVLFFGGSVSVLKL